LASLPSLPLPEGLRAAALGEASFAGVFFTAAFLVVGAFFEDVTDVSSSSESSEPESSTFFVVPLIAKY